MPWLLCTLVLLTERRMRQLILRNQDDPRTT
jgi:hypothetical protein